MPSMIERFSDDSWKTDPKLITLQPITTESNNAMDQSKFPAITCHLHKAREKSRVQDVIGFGLASPWLKNWGEILKPITKQSNRNRVINFNNHFKSADKIAIEFDIKTWTYSMLKHQLCTWSRYVTKALYRTLWRCLDTSYMPLYTSKPQTRARSNATCTPELCTSQLSPALWCYWCQTWKARWLPEVTYSSKLESGLGEGDEAFCGKQIMGMINIERSWTHNFAKLIRVLMYLKILA